MKKIALGKTSIQVSRLGLGCMHFGSKDCREESFKRLDQFVEAGGNFLDTANIYAHWVNDTTKGGESECVIGEWLNLRKTRSQVIIASKVGFPYPGVEYGTSAQQIKNECEKSLKRLQTDYLDVYFAHTDDLNTPMEESLQAFNELLKEGKIRAIGASNFKAWRLERARQIAERNGWVDYCCVQQRYSYLRPKAGWDFGGQIAANDDLLEYVKATGITLIAYSPLLCGAYGNSEKKFQEHYCGRDSDVRLKALAQIAEETHATKNQLVYYWLMHGDPPAIPLVASTTDGQFAEAMGSLTIEVTDDQMKRLNCAKW